MAEKETPVPAAKQSERKELQTLNKRNYQKELDKLIENIQKEGKTPRLFLHACCAPCSSYVMEYLSQYFEITIFFYNPNIAPEEEYAHRVAEIRRLIGEMEFVHPVTLVEGRYDPKEFYEMAKGLEDVPEGEHYGYGRAATEIQEKTDIVYDEQQPLLALIYDNDEARTFDFSYIVNDQLDALEMDDYVYYFSFEFRTE